MEYCQRCGPRSGKTWKVRERGLRVGGTSQTEAVMWEKARGLMGRQKTSWPEEERLCKGSWKRI